METQEIKDYMCSAAYVMVYEKCLKSYDELNRKFPNMCEEIKKDKWTKHLKEVEPTMTDKEQIAHAFAMVIMTYYTFV